MPDLKLDLDRCLDMFRAHGGTDEAYLRVHFPRFVRTQRRFLADGDVTRGALLDVGAHWLHQALLYALEGFEVTALDTPATFCDEHVRTVAVAHGIALLPESDLATACALQAVPDDTFDVVLFTEVLEHLAFNPVAMWKEIYRVMKPGAHLVVTTPNYYALRGRAWHWLRFLRGGGAGVDVDDLLRQPTFAHHFKEYSLGELERYFAALSADFKLVAAAHTPKYETSRRHPLLDECARFVERIVPCLRPNLYAHFRLAQKQRGIRIDPQW
jgi:2-polyprenyl-6-hydroxyphenyl methylase/3-demethylubiquinone-9 3-methyltransferase